MTERDTAYDVAILGGGLAGLTLALELGRRRPGTRIVVVERRPHPVPEAAWKVGESTVELGTWYLREVLGLGEVLDRDQLPKLGLRFFLSAREHAQEIEKRVEIGPTGFLPVPSHQLDRGRFESDLARRVAAAGARFLDDSRIEAVELRSGSEPHRVTVRRGDRTETLAARWVVDACGRAALLKRQLGLAEEVDHRINAVWWRMKGDIDVDTWSADVTWRERLRPGERRLSTNHLMGAGYWVWLIPLSSGSTSVGIVADPDLHPFDEINTFEKALAWLREHEPLAAREVASRQADLQDFLVLRGYSHHCSQVYSPDRWALTGDAGSFLDPLYSPGTDFIAISNGFVTDLVCSDLDGRPVRARALQYDELYRKMFETWLPVYRGLYPVMGNDRVMVSKVLWDFAFYWGVLVPSYVNGAYTDFPLMGSLREEWARLEELHAEMQALFRALGPEDCAPPPAYTDPLEEPTLRELHCGMTERLERDAFRARFSANRARLEELAARMTAELRASVSAARPRSAAARGPGA